MVRVVFGLLALYGLLAYVNADIDLDFCNPAAISKLEGQLS